MFGLIGELEELIVSISSVLGVVGKESLNEASGSAGKCETCQISFNSQSQSEAHLSGSKHRKKLEAQGKSTLVTTAAGKSNYPQDL